MTFIEKHRAFVQDMRRLSKDSGSASYNQLGEFYRRLLRASGGNPRRFLLLVKKTRPVAQKIILLQGMRARGSAARAGSAFARYKEGLRRSDGNAP